MGGMRILGKHLAIAVVACAPIVGAAAMPQTPAGPPPIRLPLARVTPDATIEAGGERHFAVTPEGVWVTNRAGGTVSRIDAKSNATGAPVVVGKEPCHGAVVAFASLWAPLCGSPGVARVDIAGKEPTVVVISKGIKRGGPLTSGTGSIWMIADPAGVLVRIDPDANAVVAEVTVPSGAAALTFGHDAVWVASSAKDVVTRVNGYSNVVMETIKVGRAPSAVAVGEGSVWVWSAGDGSVSRIDPKTNKVAETIKTGVTASGGAITVGEGSVWVSAPGAPLMRIDPTTNRLVQQFNGPGGGTVAVGLKSLWLAATPAAVWRLDPKRVEATRR